MTSNPPPTAPDAGRAATGKPGWHPREWPRWLVVATALGVTVAGLLAARGLLAGPQQAADQPATPSASRASGPTAGAALLGVTPGRRAPDFAVPTAAGQRFHLAAQHGHAVVLSFLAPGCTDCAQEVAALSRAWEGFKARGVDVLVVDLGGGPIDQVAAYYRSLGGADYLYAADPGFRVAKQYQVVALDTTVVVDPAGTVTFRDEVSTSPATLRRALQKALA